MASIPMGEVEASQKFFPPIKTGPPGTHISLAFSNGWEGPVAQDIFYFSVGYHCPHPYDRAPHTGLLHALIIIRNSVVLVYCPLYFAEVTPAKNHTDSQSPPMEDWPRLDPGRVILAILRINLPFTLISIPYGHCFYQATRKATKIVSVLTNPVVPSLSTLEVIVLQKYAVPLPTLTYSLGHHAPLFLPCPLATLPCLFHKLLLCQRRACSASVLSSTLSLSPLFLGHLTHTDGLNTI